MYWKEEKGKREMKFADINLQELESKGYDKMLILRNGTLFLAGKTSNIVSYRTIIKDMEIKSQNGDDDIWQIELS